MRAADAVAPNLAYPPQWRLPTTNIKPLARSKFCRRHAAVMFAAGTVFLSCCHCVRATGYGLARPSISEWVDIWRIEGLLTQKLYRNGCITYGQMPAPLIGVSVGKYDIRIQTVCAITVSGCQSRASATPPGNSTEHPQNRQNTRLTAFHREVRPSRHSPARSPRRLCARRRGQFAFKMRFHIAKLSINRSWVSCDQVSFWSQIPKETPFKSIMSRRALYIDQQSQLA